MEYTVFTRKEFPKEKFRKMTPTVRFSRRTGVVYFSKAAVEMMDLHDGDKVEVLQSQRDAQMLGFRKTSNPLGFELYDRRAGMGFAAHRLTYRILALFGTNIGFTVQLGTEPMEGAYWIITKSLIKTTSNGNR